MSDIGQGSRVGSQFGPYYLKRLLGRGGMGEVYEAEHTVKQWTVALKLLSEKFSQDPVFRKRMQREARTAGRLQEPHVVPIHDYGEIDGQLYLEMRLIEGTDLDTLLKRFGPLPPPRAVAIVHQVAAALDAAHAAGVMHRDVKPANVLITGDDFAYLVDFGIASATTDEKLTQLGSAMGTWKYMAPERFSNAEVTYRADIYALACVLHECLTGSPPYRADSMSVLITAHMHQPIPRPSQVRPGVPAAFDEVIARGMAKRPEDRYASAGDLALAAHQALSTVDQDQAATLLRRSQEVTLPATASEPTLPPTFVPPPSPPTPRPTPGSYPGLGDSGRLPRPAPAPSPGERASWAPESGPIHTPAGGQPAASPQFFQGGGGWPGQFGTPGQPPPGGPPPPPWSQPPGAPNKRSPWFGLGVAAVVVVAVLVVVLGGVGIWLHLRGSSQSAASKSSTTTSPRASSPPVTTSPSAPSTSGAQARLLNLLPQAYAGKCTPEDVNPTAIWRDALAIVRCDRPPNPGGPTSALFALFPDINTLNNAFNATTSSERIVPCPNGKASPGNWWNTDNPSVILGRFECLNNGDDPEFEWSNTSELLVGSINGSQQGPTLDDLYAWWDKYT